MRELVFLCICAAGSYFLGAIPTAYIVTKIVKGVDIRTLGSGNVGATNVFRSVSKRWGLFVFAMDTVKGVFAVTVWAVLAPLFGFELVSERFLFICGLVAVCGHNWTVFLNFKGGKGVATTLGILLGLFPLPVSIAAVIAFTLIGITHFVSVGSIVGALVFPVLFALCNRDMDDFAFFMGVVCAVAVLIVVKHRANIKRLLKGEENKAF